MSMEHNPVDSTGEAGAALILDRNGVLQIPTACAGTLLHAGGARAPAASRWRSTSSLNPCTGAGATCPSGGIHYCCLRASLAVLEPRIAFAALLDRFASTRLAAELRHREAGVMRGVEHLWIELQRMAAM